MESDAPDPVKSETDTASDLPTTADIVARLDRLWESTGGNAPGDSTRQRGQVGRYTLEERVGVGAFGIVWRAHDAQLDRLVALKIPRPEVLVDDDKLSRFQGEAQAVAGLSHPAIVPIYEADLVGPIPFIALEFVHGPDLGQFLENRADEIPWRHAVAFVAELASAVHYAHQLGVYHRDLKPSNVLLVPHDPATPAAGDLNAYQAKLTDFGLAKLAQDNLVDTRSSMILGTPLYMAPEMLLGSQAPGQEPAADVYSLGCLLYELLAGRPPIEAENYVEVIDKLRESRPAPVTQFRTDVPSGLAVVCRKCLEKDPAARYATAALLAEDLQRLKRGETALARSGSNWQRFRYWVAQPPRMREAGWYAIFINAAALVWLSILAFMLPQFGLLTGAGYRATLIDAGIAVFTVHAPMTVLGIFTLRRSPWAIYLGLVMSMYATVISVLAMMGIAPIFAEIYRETPYHGFAAFVQMSVTFLGQSMLYLFAVIALRRSQSAPTQNTQ